MSKELGMQSSTLSSSFHDDSADGDGVQLHTTLKISVLYYKKHTKTAIPVTGTLRLGQKTISFQSKGLEFIWNLDSIRVEKFKGRVNGGIKIWGKRQMGEGSEDDEYIFTSVKQRSYERICTSIDEAKFDSEMKKVRKASAHAIAMNGNIRATLRHLDKRDPTAKQSSLSLLMKPFQFILSAICRFISFVHKICTGRRLWGPKDMRDALNGVSTNIKPILVVSKMTLSSETRVMAIKKDVISIRESLMAIERVVRQLQSQFTSNGSVVDHSPTDTAAYLRQRGISFSLIATAISFFFFTIRRVLNLKRYNWELVETYPSTVGQAVQNANDKLEALMELAANEKYPPESMTKIMGEAKHIQMLLYNVKVHSADISQASPKEE